MEINKRKLPVSVLRERILQQEPARNFLKAIRNPGKVTLIAEIKKASPSAGVIKKRLFPERIARLYQENGAAAISVLTEEKFFLGKLEYLERIRKISRIPVLRKDFIFDEYQVFESRAYGADALLLIASLLSSYAIGEFLELSRNLGMEGLVEVHTAEELQMVLDTSARIIGINNRNLRNLTVDLNTTLILRPLIPSDRMVVSESGISNREDIRKLQEAKVDAVLVGESLMRARDIVALVKEFSQIDDKD